ncbi:urease accessory protein UreD [Pelagibacterium sp. 26DY04]|uniref:urease accessory protein UreD n=1 Tax=Pelagibacterium sp. 26DY04 TaxID=2967130 RepID=UPI002815AB6A|nr:urease accessory protein UreD [Pelagibacterium sp. 26DY04]WMT87213.1 urease accessory protein UreD [Pelagibacterium sp. 26DY04]
MLVSVQSPGGPAALQRAEGEGRIVAKGRAGLSVLDTLYQRGCGKIRVPKTHGNWLEAVLINTSGGLTGGDRMTWSAQALPNTHLVVTTQACERIYRSSGGAADVRTTLSVQPGARLDWLPQETIVFDGSALRRTLEVDLAEDATFLGLEAVILGREAHGEDALAASISDRWQVRRAGKLVHAEAARLDADDTLARDNMALLGGARAYATLLYIAPDAERRIEKLKQLAADHPGAGVSRIGDKIVLRALDRSGYHLRKIVMPAIAALAGAGAVPRLWSL